MKHGITLTLIAALAICAGCASSPQTNARSDSAGGAGTPAPLLEKDFVLEVVRYVYRWHFDQSYMLEAGNQESLEVWSRKLHPTLDAEDKSDYAEMWFPAAKTLVELKRAEYKVPELKLEIAEPSFKVTRVVRQPRPPAPRKNYQTRDYPAQEVKDYLFVTRTNRVPISEGLRTGARQLIADYLNKAHPEPFTQDQTFYVSPISSVCNEVWVFWETGRKVMLFSADMDLANPAFSRLSQLRMQVIDLDKDVVASTREIPGSNAFVTKDWVGRLFFNCILFGEKIVRSPAEISRLQTGSKPEAAPK